MRCVQRHKTSLESSRRQTNGCSISCSRKPICAHWLRSSPPPLPLNYYRNLHEALENLQSVGTLVISQLGSVDQPDIVPEIADLLLRMHGKTWSMCTGVHNDRVYVSMRTTNSRADAGRLMRRLLGRRGKGGGHGMMAGGWIEYKDTRNGDPNAVQRHLAQRLATLLKKKPEKLSPITMSGDESDS